MDGHVEGMATDNDTAARTTAAAMHDTAGALETTEDTLHDSAERTPDPRARARLRRLADDVSAEARKIDKRADELPPRSG